MTPTEAVKLTRYVRACCPQQHIDEYTPDAWHDLLSDLDLNDCHAAVVAITRRQPFVAPAEIRDEVRRVREQRLAAAPIPPPAADPDDEYAYKAALVKITRQIAGGRMPFRAIAGGKARSEPTAEFKNARSGEDRDRVLAQSIACPVEWCNALPGEPCRPGHDLPPLKRWHPSRLGAARKASA